MNNAFVLKNMFIFGAIGIILFLFFTNNSNPATIIENTKPQEYMCGLQAINYDEHGKPQQNLYADRWEFIKDKGNSKLTKPKVIVYKSATEIWHLTADNATAWHANLQDKISKVELYDNVRLSREPIADNPETVLTTTSLDYYPLDDKIYTDSFAKLEQPDLIISGHGLTGYLKQNWIELHEKVTTIYTH